MRKIVIAFLLGAMILPALAQAQMKWTSQLITWRTSGSPTGVAYYDSSSMRHSGTNTVVDTTAGMANPFWVNSTAGSAADTSVYAAFSMEPTAANQAISGTDSIWVGVQLSTDGYNWVPMLPTQTHVVAGNTPYAIGCLRLGGGTGAVSIMLPLHAALQVPTQNLSGATVIEAAAWMFPQIRFIVGGDFTGEYVAHLYSWNGSESAHNQLQ